MDVSPTHPACLSDAALLEQCRVERGKGSGPGGQRRNKVETAIRLVHEPTGIDAAASERRSQIQNQKVATFRLRINLALGQRGYFRPQDVPSPLWQSRASKGKIRVNPEHRDFPAILAELLDILAAKRWEPRKAAVLFEVSATQLVKLLKAEPRALAMVNEHREKSGLHGLK